VLRRNTIQFRPGPRLFDGARQKQKLISALDPSSGPGGFRRWSLALLEEKGRRILPILVERASDNTEIGRGTLKKQKDSQTAFAKPAMGDPPGASEACVANMEQDVMEVYQRAPARFRQASALVCLDET